MPLVTVGGVGTFTYFYAKYSRLIDQKLSAGPFANTAKIFAAPRNRCVGDPVSRPPRSLPSCAAAGIANRAAIPWASTNSGPTPSRFSRPRSYFDQEAGRHQVRRRPASRRSFRSRTTPPRSQYQLEPQLITNLSDRNREKRRLVQVRGHSQVLVRRGHLGRGQALLPARRLRPHPHRQGGLRGCEGRPQGPGRLHPQPAARAQFWLDQDKSWTRKLAEMIITLQLEQKLIQGRDLRGLRQPDLPRTARHLRHPRLRRGRRRPTSARTSASSPCPRPPCWPA